MKLRCVKNWIWDVNRDSTDLSKYLTIGKIYHLSNNTPASEYVYNIIDDLNGSHDMNKNLFVDITQQDREDKLNELGI
jgi:hypothetical protein